MKHKKGKTGRIRHGDMTSLHGSKGVGGKDPHAHASHNAANSAAGMKEGMSPTNEGCCGDGDETQGLTGGNQECCE